MGGGRGVERATAEAVDRNPPPYLSYQQDPAPSSQQTKQCKTAQRETRAGRGGFTNRPQPSKNSN